MRGVSAVDLDLFGSLDPGSPDAPMLPDALAEAARNLFDLREQANQGSQAVLMAESTEEAETLFYLPSASTGLLILDEAKASDYA